MVLKFNWTVAPVKNSKLDSSKIQLNRCSSRKAHVFPLLVLCSARKDAGGGLKAFAGEIGRRKRFRSWWWGWGEGGRSVEFEEEGWRRRLWVEKVLEEKEVGGFKSICRGKLDEETKWGGRSALLWAPVDNWTVPVENSKEYRQQIQLSGWLFQ